MFANRQPKILPIRTDACREGLIVRCGDVNKECKDRNVHTEKKISSIKLIYKQKKQSGRSAVHLEHRRPTAGPRAKCGPLRHFMWPARAYKV